MFMYTPQQNEMAREFCILQLEYMYMYEPFLYAATLHFTSTCHSLTCEIHCHPWSWNTFFSRLFMKWLWYFWWIKFTASQNLIDQSLWLFILINRVLRRYQLYLSIKNHFVNIFLWKKGRQSHSIFAGNGVVFIFPLFSFFEAFLFCWVRTGF